MKTSKSKVCSNCNSKEIRRTGTGKLVCNVCLYILEESVQYSEEFKFINFNFTKRRGVTQAHDGDSQLNLSYQEHIESKINIKIRILANIPLKPPK